MNGTGIGVQKLSQSKGNLLKSLRVMAFGQAWCLCRVGRGGGDQVQKTSEPHDLAVPHAQGSLLSSALNENKSQ